VDAGMWSARHGRTPRGADARATPRNKGADRRIETDEEVGVLPLACMRRQRRVQPDAKPMTLTEQLHH